MALQIDTPQRPITVDEFDRMVEVGILKPTVEVYREPHDLSYGMRSFAPAGQLMSFAAFPDVTFPIDELLGAGAKAP